MATCASGLLLSMRVFVASLLLVNQVVGEFQWGVTAVRGGDPLVPTTPQRPFPSLEGPAPAWETTQLALREDNAMKKMRERSAWLSRDHSEGEHFRHKINPSEIWALFEDVYACPWTLDKSPSVSKLHDGGKWTCGLVEVGRTRPEASRCVVYSFGSAQNVAFEKRVRELSDCAIHTFDPTCAPARLRADQGAAGSVFHSLGLGARPDPSPTFPVMDVAAIMRALDHASVDVLKVDVEGAEFEALNATFYDPAVAPRVGQILLEVHLKKKSAGAHQADILWHTLERCGFRQFSIEPVTMGNAGQVEVAFIHKDWTPSGWRT